MLHKSEPLEANPTTMSYTAATPEKETAQSEILSQVQDKELAELTSCLNAARMRYKSRNRALRNTLLLFCAGLLMEVLGIYIASTGGGVPSYPLSNITLLSALGVGPLLAGSLYWVRMSRRAERDAAKRLASMEDTRAAAPIIDALASLHVGALQPILWNALGRLLPRLSEEECWELGIERSSQLAAWIQSWCYSIVPSRDFPGVGNELLFGMLHVMAHIGQDRFQIGDVINRRSINLLPILEGWAAGEWMGRDLAVQKAAQTCLKDIRLKIALAKSGEHLLRASAPTPASSETLLRPAQNSEQTDPQELLRPDTSE